MFTADMRERDQDKIHMKGLTAAGFGHILRFMYYGSLELSMPTVQEILQVAPHAPRRDTSLLFQAGLTENPAYPGPPVPLCFRRPCTSS